MLTPMVIAYTSELTELCWEYDLPFEEITYMTHAYRNMSFIMDYGHTTKK